VLPYVGVIPSFLRWNNTYAMCSQDSDKIIQSDHPGSDEGLEAFCQILKIPAHFRA